MKKLGKKNGRRQSLKKSKKKRAKESPQHKSGSDKEQDKISKYRRELDTLESLEVKAMLKEIDMPLDQVKELLKNMKSTPMQTPGSANE